jgi:hypothetical protein
VRIVHGLMFYPILRRLNLVPLRVSKVHRVNNLLDRLTIRERDTIASATPLRILACFSALSSAAQITFAEKRAIATAEMIILVFIEFVSCSGSA